MMDLPIVDSHVHLWDPTHFSMPWLADIPLLNRPYGLRDYEQGTKDLPIAALVSVEAAVEPAEALLEARWLDSLAQNEPRLQAIVAAAPLEQGPAVRAHLESLVALSPRIKGVRRNLQDESLDFCLQPTFLHGVQMLAEYSLSFDLCITHQQLPGVTELVRQCPDTAFVLDHIGKPDIKHSQLHPWRTYLKELAALPNVQCKVSGMVTEADHRFWKVADLAPFVQTVFENFGEDRVMFGGDWPVISLASAYHRWHEALGELTSHLSLVAQRKFWGDNARRFYRMP
ncbi:MAG TPA: amidohydrolase family protein [Ktedonobacteraceae bacterium]|nr:amidohydrolase family protein [Ktedonobacteraceae bacterium]